MIHNPIIKVCGMRNEQNICAVDALGVDLMGFIFYPRSSRYVAFVPSSLPAHAKRVGVFVDGSIDEVAQRISEFGLDYVQLHGSESPQFCKDVAALGVKIIKAFSVDSSFDFSDTEPYESCCDYFVFDTKCSGYGGSGEQFEWSLLERYQGSVPFLLSGGVAPNSVEHLAGFSHPWLAGYDLNSRFEIEPALKDVELLRKFVDKIKK